MSEEIRVYTQERGTTAFIGPRKEDRAKRFAVEHYKRTRDQTMFVTRVQETDMMSLADIVRFTNAGWY